MGCNWDVIVVHFVRVSTPEFISDRVQAFSTKARISCGKSLHQKFNCGLVEKIWILLKIRFCFSLFVIISYFYSVFLIFLLFTYVMEHSVRTLALFR